MRDGASSWLPPRADFLPIRVQQESSAFPNEPHVPAGLLNALMFVGDDDARRVAREALGHRAFIVRRAAAQALQHMNPQAERTCERREP
jgi:hypothetical protein